MSRKTWTSSQDKGTQSLTLSYRLVTDALSSALYTDTVSIDLPSIALAGLAFFPRYVSLPESASGDMVAYDRQNTLIGLAIS